MSEPSELPLTELPVATATDEGSSVETILAPAPGGDRFGARLLDFAGLLIAPLIPGTLISITVMALLHQTLGGLLFWLFGIPGILAFFFMDLLPRASLGKRMCGLQILHDGEPASVMRRLVWIVPRHLELAWISAPALFQNVAIWFAIWAILIGLKILSIAFVPLTGGRTWYDWLCGMTVVMPRTIDGRKRGWRQRGFEVIPTAKLNSSESPTSGSES